MKIYRIASGYVVTLSEWDKSVDQFGDPEFKWGEPFLFVENDGCTKCSGMSIANRQDADALLNAVRRGTQGWLP